MEIGISEVLRIAGQWLDAWDAKAMEVCLTPSHVTVTGQDRRGGQFELRFTEHDLAHIQATGRTLRQDPLGSMVGCWAARLRALGAAFAREGIEPNTLTGVQLWLEVTGHQGSEPFHQRYFLPDLSIEDADCRRKRVVQPLRPRTARPPRYPVITRWSSAGGA